MINVLADALAPIFAGLLLGYICWSAGGPGQSKRSKSRHLCDEFRRPCSLFLSISRTPRAALREQTGAALVLNGCLRLALGMAMLLHLSIEQTRYVTLTSADPCGFFGIVFGKGFDSNLKLASSGLIASYALGVATLAVWIVIVNQLG